MQFLRCLLDVLQKDLLGLTLSSGGSLGSEGRLPLPCADAVLRPNLITHRSQAPFWIGLVGPFRSGIDGGRLVILFEREDVIPDDMGEACLDLLVEGNKLLEIVDVAVDDSDEQLHI